MVSLISATRSQGGASRSRANPAVRRRGQSKDGKAVIIEMVVPARPPTQDATAAAKAVFAQVK